MLPLQLRGAQEREPIEETEGCVRRMAQRIVAAGRWWNGIDKLPKQPRGSYTVPPGVSENDEPKRFVRA